MVDTRVYPSDSTTETLITQIQNLGGTPISYGLGELQRLLASLQGGGGGGGAVSSVANVDGTILASPTTGHVVLSLNQLSTLLEEFVRAQTDQMNPPQTWKDMNGQGYFNWYQSGVVIGPRTVYSPTSPYVQDVLAQTTAVAIDTTNLTMSNITAPPSGSLLVEIEIPTQGFLGAAVLDQALYFCLVNHGGSTPVSEWVQGYIMPVLGTGSNGYTAPLHRSILVSGLTPGSVHNWDLAWAASAANGAMILTAEHLTGSTPANGSIYMTPVAL